MKKKELTRQVESLGLRLYACETRVRRLEDGILAFLEAYDASEMSNTQEAVEYMRLLVVAKRG